MVGRIRAIGLAALVVFACGPMPAEAAEFAEKPKAEKKGDGCIISFTVKEACDATVAIVDEDGRIVRHLASGVLGPNAPAPFRKRSLAQEIEWDGTDDGGKPAPYGCKARVGLGLGARYERTIAWDPCRIPMVQSVTVGPDGTLYVVGEHSIRAFDREGKYVRTVMPFPAHLPREKLSGFGFLKTTDGDEIFTARGLGGPFKKMFGKGAAAVSADGKTLILDHSGGMGFKAVLRIGTDGTYLKDAKVSVLKSYAPHKPVGGIQGDLSFAFSPDGKWLYIVGRKPARGRAKVVPHAVFRADAKKIRPAKDRAPDVFIGEYGKPGADNDHFDGTSGIATDGTGNIYVADDGNNRIQVFDPEGKYLRTLPAGSPDGVAVHPGTGGVFFWNEKGITQIKPDGGAGAALVQKFVLSVSPDPTGEKPSLWMACASKGKRSFSGGPLVVDRVVRLELDGGTYREAAEIKPSIEGPSSASIAVTATPRIAADPVREEIYVKLGNIPARFDGKTGAHHPDFAKKLKGNAPRGIEDFDVGPDGLLYARAGGRAYGPFIARYGRDGSPVPFPEENSVLWNNMRVIYTGVKGTSNVQQKGFDVAPDGRIYVHASELAGGWTYMHFDGEGNIVSVPASKVEPHVKLFTAWQSKDSLGLTPTKPRGWGKGRGSLIEVYDRDGKEISINALLSTGYGHGLRADRDGNIYRGFRDARPKIGAGLVKGKFAVTGRMAKFGFNGEYPVGSEEGGSGKPKDALWTFDGITTSGAGSTCTCHAGRFDLDGFARAFVPSMHLYSIVVLDANGNRIARLGRYGNADCRGGESPVPEPDIGLCWVRAVAASDRALYALDSGNQRVLKAALIYQAEETVALP